MCDRSSLVFVCWSLSLEHRLEEYIQASALAAAQRPEGAPSSSGGVLVAAGAPAAASSGANAAMERALRASERAKMQAQESLLTANIEAQQRAAEAEAATSAWMQSEALLKETLSSARVTDRELGEARAALEELSGRYDQAVHSIAVLEQEAEVQQQMLDHAVAQGSPSGGGVGGGGGGGGGSAASHDAAVKRAKLEVLEARRDEARMKREAATLRAELTRANVNLAAAQRELMEQTKVMSQMKMKEQSAGGVVPTSSTTYRPPPAPPPAPSADTPNSLNSDGHTNAAPDHEPGPAPAGGPATSMAYPPTAAEQRALGLMSAGDEELAALRTQVRACACACACAF